MHQRPRLLIVVAALLVLAACQLGTSDPKRKDKASGPATAAARSLGNLSTLTPYPAPKKPRALTPPEGFEPVFAENISRHGSRSLTDDDLIDDALDLWDEAKSEGALTKAGRTFGPDARALRDAMDQVGFGNLSTLGKEELRAMGVREAKRLSPMFKTAIADGAKVEVLDSGRGRAEESAESFSTGLTSVHPELDVEPPESNENLLHIDTEDHDYKHFLQGDDWKPAYNQVRRLSKIDQAAVDILAKIYSKAFVAAIDDPLTEANAVWDVYRSAPAMSRDVKVDTRPFMVPKASEAFAYVDDGRYFYARGPGEDGDDRSYRAASVLLDDFLDVIDDHLAGGGVTHQHAAVYRFAHAEEIVPLAALLGLPGSDQPGTPGETYTHENNDFRIKDVAPLAGNIEWTIWAKGQTYLVSIHHNEEPTTIGRGCTPFEGTEMFYQLSELKSCLAGLR